MNNTLVGKLSKGGNNNNADNNNPDNNNPNPTSLSTDEGIEADYSHLVSILWNIAVLAQE